MKRFEWRFLNGISFNEDYNEKVLLEDMNEGDVERFEWRDLVGEIFKEDFKRYKVKRILFK